MHLFGKSLIKLVFIYRNKILFLFNIYQQLIKNTEICDFWEIKSVLVNPKNSKDSLSTTSSKTTSCGACFSTNAVREHR